MFLYTSRTDGVPNTILEVADLEVPIIASHAGGISEVIRSGETGYLVDNPEEIDGYLEAIKRFTEEPAEAKKFAKNAKKLIEKQHSWETFNKAIKKDLD